MNHFIFELRDYRQFLARRFEEAKDKDPRFSYQYCAIRLKTSRSYFKLVTQKKRHITLDKIPAIGRLFKLNELEQQYFTFLFLENTTRVPIKTYFSSVLAALRHRAVHPSAFFADANSGDAAEGGLKGGGDELFFDDWLLMSIQAMTRLVDFSPDPQWICEKLSPSKPSLKQVTDAWKTLLDHQWVTHQEGRWSPGKEMRSNGHACDVDRFKVYKVGQKRAMLAVDQPKAHAPCQFEMLAVAVRLDETADIINRMVQLRTDLLERSKNSKDPDVVLFVSNNLFSVTL